MKYSKLPRLYIKSKLNLGAIIPIEDSDTNYIKNVMRARDGDEIRIFNEVDGEFFAQIKIDGRYFFVELLKQFRDATHARNKKIILLQSIIKPEKFELVCDMATQLGITEITPIITSRVQKKEINRVRVEKIILEAVRQSERLEIPILNNEIRLENISSLKLDKIYFANEMENNKISISSGTHNCGILIGPEGGFTEEEITYLNSLSNIESISLGSNVLRAETAAISLITKILI